MCLDQDSGAPYKRRNDMWEDKYKAVTYNSFRSETIHFKNYILFFFSNKCQQHFKAWLMLVDGYKIEFLFSSPRISAPLSIYTILYRRSDVHISYISRLLGLFL